MDEATLALVILSIAILAIFLGFLIWGIKSKQFKNVEEAKYQLFDKTEKEEETKDKTQCSKKVDDGKC
jgi:nitrogen fixation-related uncharacterized protein